MQCAQAAKRPSRRRAAPTPACPSHGQHEPAPKRNAVRAGCTAGRSRARAGAPTLSCPRVGAPLERPRAFQAPSLPPIRPPLRSGPAPARVSLAHRYCAAGQVGRGGHPPSCAPRPGPQAPGPPPAHWLPGPPRKCTVRAGPAKVAWPRHPPLGKRVLPHRGSTPAGQLTQDAVRGAKARAEAPARAQGPACCHRQPIWRVARGAAGRYVAPVGPLHGALCGVRALRRRLAKKRRRRAEMS